MAVHQAGRALHGTASGSRTLSAASTDHQAIVVIALLEDAAPTNWLYDKFLPPVASGLVIALVAGWWIPRALERFRGERDHLNRSLDALRAQLAALQKVSGAYWTKKHDPRKSPPEAAEIQFLLQDITSLCLACAPHIWRDRDNDGPGLITDLADVATGPTFGSASRVAEPARVAEVAQRAAVLMRRLTADRTSYFADRTLARVWRLVRQRLARLGAVRRERGRSRLRP